MAQKIDKVKKELEKEEDEFYGDETESGSSPDPESIQKETTRELVEDVTGRKPKLNKPYNIGEEINKEEKDLFEE